MLQPDKIKHAIIGLLMAVCFFAAGDYFFDWSDWMLALLSFLAVAIIGYGFELFSKITGRGHYELMDAIVTAIGGALGVMVAWLIIR